MFSLSIGVSLFSTLSIGVSAFMGEQEEILFACSSGAGVEGVKKILEEDPTKAKYVSHEGEGTLHTSAISEHNGLELIKLLVEHGAEVDQVTTTEYHRTPLMWYCSFL